eukprot:2876124-Pyramimonas_sp.AAC.1
MGKAGWAGWLSVCQSAICPYAQEDTRDRRPRCAGPTARHKSVAQCDGVIRRVSIWFKWLKRRLNMYQIIKSSHTSPINPPILSSS